MNDFNKLLKYIHEMKSEAEGMMNIVTNKEYSLNFANLKFLHEHLSLIICKASEIQMGNGEA